MVIQEPKQLKELKRRWKLMTIRQKILYYTTTVFLCIFLSVAFNIWVARFSLGDFNTILNDCSKTSGLVQAIERENYLFEQYMKGHATEERGLLNQAMQDTKEAVEDLPFDYKEIGKERYSKTWSIRSCYEMYEEKRDEIFDIPRGSVHYVDQLYVVYAIQGYLRGYATELMNDTLAAGSSVYRVMLPIMILVPFIMAFFAIVIIACVLELSRNMNRTIILPVMKLVESAKRIANNDFYIEDVKVESQDEIGELVRAFNKMKFATGEYILTLEENRRTRELLHKEELEKLEVERRLETMKLEVLINQVNPHFLFNTLNVIGGMAMLENAETTEKMIMALSNLFRYNLKNSGSEAMLSQELHIVRDYMYIQQMRFGERVGYHISCETDETTIVIPIFTFQPLIENAIIHGMGKKEEGGKIYIRVWEREEAFYITVHDTGIGMSKETLERLKKKLADGNVSRDSIGVGNVYRRFKIMYPNGQFDIYSREGKGTLIKLQIPKK